MAYRSQWRYPLTTLFLATCAVALLFTACGGPQADTQACERAPDNLIVAAQNGVDAPGTLRHLRILRSPDTGRVFLTGELHLEEDQWWIEGDLLTWVVSDGDRLEAVDEQAREVSRWPPAAFTLGDDRDAVKARGCTLVLRGTVDVDQHDLGCPAAGLARRECIDDRLEELQDRLEREHDERA